MEGTHTSGNHVGSRSPSRSSRSSGKQAASGVRIVIRSSDTKCYVSHGKDWSDDVAHARAFNSALEAELFCRQHVSTPVELLVFRKERPPLTIPLKLT
jgi:hypothetical protein